MITFKDLPLVPEVQAALDTLGFTEPTDIQRQAIPLLLGSSKIDFHGQAQTGTGKTLAFGLPLLHRIDRAHRTTQALVVAPTRELALQIYESMLPFAKSLGISIEPVYGGMSMEEQMRALRRGVHIVVGTPGRLNDHLRRGTLSLSAIKTVVLDEADIMLDMGFKEEVEEILTFAPQSREIWLFSATVKDGIASLMAEYMEDTQSVRVSKKTIGTAQVKQYYCVVPMRSRLNALCRFIEAAPEFYGFVFCQTKMLTAEIAEELTKRGYSVGGLHGDMSQAQRNAVIKKFKSKDISIVVATDVAARGIDVANLTHVVNYSLPEDHESYVHRVGRTGRAGKEGTAITFINRSEVRLIEMVKRKFSVVINPIEVPSREDIIKGRLAQAAHYVAQLFEKTSSVHERVSELVSTFAPDEVRLLCARVLEDKFLTSILSEEEIAFAPAVVDAAQNQELVLAVGSDDGVDREQIIQLLVKTGGISEDHIKKIRVIKRRSFVEVPPQVVSGLMGALKTSMLAGRRVHLKTVEPEDQDRRGGSGRRGGFGAPRGGDRRRSGGDRFRSRGR